MLLPIGLQYPYVQAAQEYLENAGCNVKDHFVFMENPNKPIVISWKYSSDAVTSFTVEYAAKSDYSDAVCVDVASDCRQIELYNLFKATEYFARLTAYAGEEILNVDEARFSTTSLGPRVMKIDGIYNVRDLGGYAVGNGETTRQGLLYRGDSLTPADVYDSNLTESGRKYMSEVMKIKTEIDLRAPDEAGGLAESVIPGAVLIYTPLGGYADAFSDGAFGKSSYRKFFSALANENNYPIYYHCTGGADRTGTVSFLLNALLGVDEQILINDYEFTSFSVFNIRNSREGSFAPLFKDFRDRLEAMEGKSLQEKAENYLLFIGVTADEICSIKAIMTGKPTRNI